VILVILILNAIVGVWQETNAENALAALKQLQPEHATTLRNGRWETLTAAELVPGDVVEVRTGDRVPADMRLLKMNSTSLRIEQSQLTGESQSVSKDPYITHEEDAVIQGKTNMLFSSTAVSNGSAVAVVCFTGMKTEIGEGKLKGRAIFCGEMYIQTLPKNIFVKIPT
jgi:P-type Ca2+ transporter type 2C